jgi:hypothetical protein
VRQHRPAEPHRTEEVNFHLPARLLFSERFGDSDGHVACVVDQNVEASAVCKDLIDSGFNRIVQGDVKFHNAQSETLVARSSIDRIVPV